MRYSNQGFGGGKAILLGEHAVVHGIPALAVGLPRGVSTLARVAHGDALHISPWERSVSPDSHGSDPLARAFADVLASHPKRPRLRVEAHVDLPPGAGLGCSAALGVSVLDAIDKALGIRRSRTDLAAEALRWERHFHGDPSGIDNLAAALGGLIRFERSRGAAPLATASSLHLVVAHSGERSETKTMVSRVAAHLKRQPVRTRRLFQQVRALVESAERNIRLGNVVALGAELDANHEILRALELSTPRVEALRDRCKRAGALGAKVTGAGGGGCVVALAETPQDARAVANAVDENDAFVVEIAHGV